MPRTFDVEVTGLKSLVQLLDGAHWCMVEKGDRSKHCPVLVEVKGE